MPKKVVIVVGTTPDYVQNIYQRRPKDTRFILDRRYRDDSFLESVDKSSIIFSNIYDQEETFQSVHASLDKDNLVPLGVACFDCDSLIPASNLALHFGVLFPDQEAITRTRDKFQMRRTLRDKGLCGLEATIASGLEETMEFFHRVRKKVVLKPVLGGGSELLFCCGNEGEIEKSVKIMESQLPKRNSNPLFMPVQTPETKETEVHPWHSWLVEEFIPGPEFSCDFIFHDNEITILRETGKVKATGQTFGSVLAYTFPPEYPDNFSIKKFDLLLRESLQCLGFTWGHFMVDYIINNGNPIIIEITPRPGGDSIPDLVEVATGNDLLCMHLDIASGKYPLPGSISLPGGSYASINIYAEQEGTISYLDPSHIIDQPWVKKLFLKKKVGDEITLPPDDYDNRLLGYCIVSLDDMTDPGLLAENLQGLMRVSFTHQKHLYNTL